MKKTKVKPGMLGTGGAARAAKAKVTRKSRMKKALGMAQSTRRKKKGY